MSDTKSEPQQQHSSSSTESSSQTPQTLVAAAATAVVESPPAAVSSPTSADSPAIIETTSTTLTLGDHGKPPLATEEDSSSTNSNIPAVTVTVIESSIPTANSSSSTTASSIQIESTFTATVHQPSIIVERQTSVSSTEGSMSNSNNANAGGSGFRSSFNGRVPFARILSTGSAGDRRAVGNDAARVSGNLSNNLLNDIFAFVQQARNPNSLFSSERRSLFLQSGRSASHMPGSSTPPIGHATTGNPSDVVIDLDNATGPSLRSSNNEIYPISTSSSIASGIRPNSWMPANTTDEDAIASRASIMPNFNYHHHHHHFHNHQPLSTIHHHQHLAHPQPALLQQAQTAQQSQPASLGATGNGGSANEPPQRPSSPTNPNPNNGTRSNSVSSNQPNDEATVHEALNQIPEARAMMDTFARYIPLLFILVTKLCYDHLDGIIHFLALLMTFSHANWVVRQEISKQAQKRIMVLLREMIFIGIALAVVGFVLERKNIFLSILFMPDLSEPQTLKTLLFSVCMSDLVLKLLTIIVKIVITLMPPSVIEYKSRGKIYLMTESLSQLYRAAAPIQPWLIFLFESYSGSEKIVGVILSAVYMVAKSSDLLDRIKFCKRSVIKLLQKTSYGTIPSKEQLQACGGQCPICHDNFNSPVLLECNHIFCELCVGTWFDREQTCPLCRAKIVDDPSYRDGATTFFLQLY
ncbi:RING finger and transmembrane domain-containing protein 2 [Aedes aegypti]|uniref:RING-type domain-containing protein n=1 Tax=Aedes aegypti TaxID=7159 RepID=A0A6I8TI07_AEDAE|nr:RING finger and transmembrane domain-containing protein 2 [Aedes aegypti]XP_021713121.1 RING finger and transmembrane domain-containing protein 2 [Aedes aegypti]